VMAFSLPDPSAAAALLEGILERERVGSLVAIRTGLLCAVIDAAGLDPIELARKVRMELSSRFAGVRAARVAAAPTHSLRLSFHEARCALEAVRLQNGDAPEVASYAISGPFQLLLSLQDDDALISYCRSVLGPVEQGEGDYARGAAALAGCVHRAQRHWEKAASALYCHRHTLRYRIRRVEQLMRTRLLQRP